MPVVRLVLEREGLTEGARESREAAAAVEVLEGKVEQLGREAKPAAASISRLSVEEKQAGAAARTAAPGVDKLGDELLETGRQARVAGGQLAQAGAAMKGIGGVSGALAGQVKGAALAFLSFQAVKAIITGVVTATREDETATALLEARIRSTGGAALRTAGQLDALAGSLSGVLGIDDESIKMAEVELLQFDDVYGQVFDRAIRLSTDLGAVSGDVAGEMTLLAKALQDPEEGIAGLEKSLGRLTDAEAKTIVETARLGDHQRAQNMLLDIVERRVGGTAEAYRRTLGGALRAASTEFENQQEIIGSRLSPVIQELTEDYIRWAQSAEGQARIAELAELLGNTVRVLAEAFQVLDPAMRLVGGTFGLILKLINPLLSGLGDLLDILDPTRAIKGFKDLIGVVDDTEARVNSINLGEATAALEDHMGAVFDLRQEYGELGLAAVLAAERQLDAMKMEAEGHRQRAEELRRAAERERKRPRKLGEWEGEILDTGPHDKEVAAAKLKAANLDKVISAMTPRLEEHRRVASEAAHAHNRLGNSALEAAEKLVAAVREEAEQQERLRAITLQAGVSREELTKRLREAEIQEKANAKVEQIRAAYLKAGVVLTDANAAAIRAWVVQAERAADATKKWASIELPPRLDPIDIPVTLTIVDEGEAKKITASWHEATVAEMQAVVAHLAAMGEVRKTNQAAIDEHNQAIYDDLVDQAIGLKESLKTPRQELADFNRYLDVLGEVADSSGQKILTLAEIEELRARAADQYTRDAIGAWVSFLNQLGDEFGGFFARIAEMANSFQQAGAFGQNVGQIAGMMGAQGSVGYGGFGGTGAMGAAAGIGATAYIFYQIYDMVSKAIADSKTRNYGGTAEYGLTNRIEGISQIDGSTAELVKSIRGAVRALEDALRISVRDLAEIGVQVRNDGKYVKAYVQGVLVGKFGDVDEAIQAALRVALTDPATNLAGMSDLMRQGLSRFTSPDTEELFNFLGRLRQISDLSLGPLGVQLQQAVLEFNRMREALSHLDQSSAAVIEAQKEITQAQLAVFADLKAQLMGIDTAASDALRSLDGLRRAMPDATDAMRSGLEESLRQAQARLDALNRGPRPNLGGGGGVGGGGQEPIGVDPVVARLLSGLAGDIDSEKARLEKAIDDYTRQLGELPKELTQQEVDLGIFTALERYLRQSKGHAELIQKFERMRVDLEFQAIKMQLIALGAWERWAGIWEELYGKAMAAAGRGAGGSGGGPNLKDLRQQLRDEIGRIQAELRGPVHAAFFDFQLALADFEKRAKDAKLPAADLAAGIAALTEQFKKSLLDQARAYAGLGTDFTNRLDEVQRFFDGLRALGRKKTGIPDWKVDALEEKAIERLGGELRAAIAEFAGMTNPMLAIQMRAGELRENLLAFAEAAGWSSEQIAAALADIDAGVEYQRQLGISSVLDQLFGMLRQAGMAEAESLEHERTKAQLQLTIIEAQLRFYGALTAQIEDWIGKLRGWIDSPAFNTGGGGGGGGGVWRGDDGEKLLQSWKSAVDAWRSAVEEFRKSLQELQTDDELTGLTQAQQLEAARARMLDLLARAQGGDTDALRELSAAQREFLSESKESFGWIDPDTWAKVIGPAQELLAKAKIIEKNVVEKAVRDLIVENTKGYGFVGGAVAKGASDIQDSLRKLSDETVSALDQLKPNPVVASINNSTDRIVLALTNLAVDDLLGRMPKYGEGGYIDRPQLALVGERGPEIIIPVRPGWRAGSDVRQPARSGGGRAGSGESPRSLRLQERAVAAQEDDRRTLKDIARSNRRLEEKMGRARSRR